MIYIWIYFLKNMHSCKNSFCKIRAINSMTRINRNISQRSVAYSQCEKSVLLLLRLLLACVGEDLRVACLMKFWRVDVYF